MTIDPDQIRATDAHFCFAARPRRRRERTASGRTRRHARRLSARTLLGRPESAGEGLSVARRARVDADGPAGPGAITSTGRGADRRRQGAHRRAAGGRWPPPCPTPPRPWRPTVNGAWYRAERNKLVGCAGGVRDRGGAGAVWTRAHRPVGSSKYCWTVVPTVADVGYGQLAWSLRNPGGGLSDHCTWPHRRRSAVASTQYDLSFILLGYRAARRYWMRFARRRSFHW